MGTFQANQTNQCHKAILCTRASLVAQLVKNLPVMWERPGFDPWVGKIPWRRESYPLQYSGLENSMDSTVHGITESDPTE